MKPVSHQMHVFRNRPFPFVTRFGSKIGSKKIVSRDPFCTVGHPLSSLGPLVEPNCSISLKKDPLLLKIVPPGPQIGASGSPNWCPKCPNWVPRHGFMIPVGGGLPLSKTKHAWADYLHPCGHNNKCKRRPAQELTQKDTKVTSPGRSPPLISSGG